MIIGVPKEVKTHEYRVSLTPAGVHDLVQAGHKVLVEENAGLGSGIGNQSFSDEGAEILSRKKVFEMADLIIKVKEPQPEEYALLRENQILYTYLHLAPAPKLTQALLKRKVIGIAYETVQKKDNSLPLLVPMSEVAGRMSIHEGAKYLERENGGRGILLGGVPGVDPGHILILGGGVVGHNAAKMAIGTGASVTLLDINLHRLRYLDDLYGGRLKTLMSNKLNLRESLESADLVICSVLITGAKAPKLITRKMLSSMKPGAVVVDVSIDQGGSLETSRPTSHDNPIFEVDGIVHYCVSNMPGALARTSTFALTNATFPYALKIAKKGFDKAIHDDEALKKGVNIYKGHITHPAVAEALEKRYTPLEELIN